MHSYENLTHYYGDKVRSLLVAAGVIMILTIPLFTELIPKPIFFSILAALLLIVLSGLMSPVKKNVVIVSTIVSAIAFISFEYYAVQAALNLGIKSPFFLINEVLSLIFVTATYFGTKSVRGLML